eukprot:5036608-Pyramimonas_sp.AAC.1
MHLADRSASCAATPRSLSSGFLTGTAGVMAYGLLCACPTLDVHGLFDKGGGGRHDSRCVLPPRMRT